MKRLTAELRRSAWLLPLLGLATWSWMRTDRAFDRLAARVEGIVYAQGGNVELVSGWTGPLEFRLLADGTALDLTGMTVTLILTAQDGTPIDTTGDTAIVDALTGRVRYTPDATDLVTAASPIQMRWKVTDGVGAVVYHPSARPAVIVVHPV